MLLWVVAILVAALLLRVFLRYNIGTCTSQARMSGKVVVVTGANAGIGYHTAKDLAARGARVILACRNEEKGQKARDQIVQETENNGVVFKRLDLASLTSVRKFCEDIIKTEQRLDVLVNNAGVYGYGDRYTEDGIVEGMQINCFGPFLLTDLLLPLLKKSKSGRIVNVTSILHYIGYLNTEKINQAGYFGNVQTYANSKFCNVVFTVELAKRLKNSGVTVNACHPGVVRTSIIDNEKFFFTNFIFLPICWFCYRSAAEAAHTSVYLSVSESCEGLSGGYYLDCARWPHSWICNNKDVAARFWAVAERLLKYKPVNMN